MSKKANLIFCSLGAAALYAFWHKTNRFPAHPPSANGAIARGKKIVILGAGFAGRNVALELANLLPAREDGEIILVDENPFLLFTPMLTEAAAGELDTDHIVSPAAHLPARIRFEQGRVDAIDLKQKRVTLTIGNRTQAVPEAQRTLSADQLVIALGSITNYHDIPGLEQHSLPMKSLQDAAAAHNRVLALLERVDGEPDVELRRALLTFVVGGGGFTGVETMAALNDLLRDGIRKFANLHPQDVRTVLVHPGDRLLPELGPELAGYAQRKLEQRGVEVRLKTRIAGAGEGYVELEGNHRIPAHLLIWAGGVKPSPVLEKVDCRRGHHGGIVVDSSCAVPGHPGVWALGDCAEIPQPNGKGTYAPTAQNATREGSVVARNIVATLGGGQPQPFQFHPLGELALVGKRTGVAQVYGFRFSGVLAWAMWRAIYWMKMPDAGQRARILLDWLLDAAFGRSVVGAPYVPTVHASSEKGEGAPA
ncbi:MAG: NAD(P)/FAD-dependent oxidoreductase [Verrucomicrobia bacterium]|nr:NAD(P)/FAD-dependent oxidoreductase [Verrucomicrobiota bacterium]